MTERSDSAYFFSVEEFLIILYKYKITGLLFPRGITDADADGGSLKKAMNSLVKEERLYACGDTGFKFRDDIQLWFDILENAKETVVMSPRAGSRESRYLYRHNDAAMILQMDDHHGSWVRVEYIVDPGTISKITEDDRTVIKKYHRHESVPYESIGGGDNGTG